MVSPAIADVPWISKRIKACCRRAKLFSTDEILLSPTQQLQQALRISPADVDLLVLQVATAVAPPPISVLDALNGKAPPILDESLFGKERNEADSEEDSGDSDADDARLPSSSIVPPTQGYDGNFPGAQQFVYDSEEDSESEAASQGDVDMHDDVEPPSTFRPRVADNGASDHDRDEAEMDSTHDFASYTAALPTVARDVLSLGRDRHVLTSGSTKLDDLLGGGFRPAVLTELVGESGSGKTQIAIQSCTFAALGFVPLPSDDDQDTSHLPLPDTLDSGAATLRGILQGFGMAPWSDAVPFSTGIGVCYITSGGERGAHSIVNRALELAEHAIRQRVERILTHSQSQEGEQSSPDELDRHILMARAIELGREQVLRNLHVACVADVEALEHALKYGLPGLINRLSRSPTASSAPAAEIGLIVVDNLPSLFQEDPVASDIDSLVQRSKMLVEIAEALKQLAVPTRPSSPGRAVLVLNHVSDAFGIDKEIAKRFVFDSADRIRLSRTQGRTNNLPESALPDNPISMDYASQSAYVSGLLASVPPTLAEAIGANAARTDGGGNDGPLYVFHPRTAQLGHTWTNLINVRLFLSKTRGRAAMPASASTSTTPTENGEASGKSVMTTVRKAAVVLNPFGPTMLDTCSDSARRTTTARQLRFAITPAQAVHALKAYTVTNTNSVSTLGNADTPASNGAVAGEEREEGEEGEEEEFGGQFDPIEEHHLLAIDRLIEEASLPNTPVS